MPAGRGVLPLADVADRERRDGPPELVIRRKHPVVAMPVLARRRDEIGQPVVSMVACVGQVTAGRSVPSGAVKPARPSAASRGVCRKSPGVSPTTFMTKSGFIRAKGTMMTKTADDGTVASGSFTPPQEAAVVNHGKPRLFPGTATWWACPLQSHV